jgi:hypothetical protein
MNLSILGRRRIWKKILVCASIFLVIYSIVGFFILPRVIKAVLTSQLAQVLHREVRISKVRVNPFALSVLINDLSIQDVKPANHFISFQTIYLNIQSSSLFYRGAVLSQIRVVGPRFSMIRNEDMSYNFSDLLQPGTDQAPAKNTKPFKFSLNNIQIMNGSIDFMDMSKHVHHSVSDIQVSIPFLSNLPKSVEIFTQPSFQANVDGTPITLNGKSKPFNNSLESSVNLNFKNLNLSKYVEYLPEDIDFRLKSGNLDSDILVSFVQSGDLTPIVAVTGLLALKDLAITDKSQRPVLKLDLFDIRIASAILFTKNIRFERIIIKSPIIQVVRSKAALVNIGSLPQKPDSESTSPAPVRSKSAGHIGAAEIKVLEGKLIFLNESSGLTEEISQIQEFSVKNTEIDLAKQNVTIDQIVFQKGDFLLRRETNGNLNVMEMVLSTSTATQSNLGKNSINQSTKAPSLQFPWVITLKQLLLEQYSVHFEDRAHSSPAIFTLNPINLKVENLSTDHNSTGKVSLQINVNKTGTLTVDGGFALNPVGADLSLDLKRFSLMPLQPYISDRLQVILTGGAISTRGRLNFTTLPKKGLTVQFKGDASLLNFGTINEEDEEDLVKWKSLFFQGIQSGFNPTHIEIREVRLTDLSSQVAINSDGQLNLKEVLKVEPQSTESSNVDTEPPSSLTTAKQGESMPIQIDRVTFRNGSIHFTDHFIQPVYNTGLTGINGTISGLSSKEDQQAEVNISCKYEDSAPISISGTINPLSKKIYVNLKLDSKAIELSPFTPYSGKYAGYTIQKGKLSFNLKYLIEDRNLNFENDIFVDQFTWGEKVESPDATKLPVSLAVSLLTDRNGQIHLNLPVTGSLDDPKFKIWRVVIQVIENILVKAATAPFALLKALAGGNEELSFVEFDYGKSDLNSSAETRISVLNKVLYDRPAIKLEISGAVDPVNDREGLKQVRFQRHLKAEKFIDLIKKGKSVASVEDIKIETGEYLTYLTKAYKKEKFPKPRNFLGFAKDLPGPEMERLMLVNTTVTDEDLRTLASSRALTIKEALLKTGQIESGRLFLVERVSPIQTQKEGQKLSRVDFAIK